jgi:hypothetical protein
MLFGGVSMEIICSNCKKSMGKKDGGGIEGVSHSICEECIRVLYGDEFTEEEIQQIMKGEIK